MIGKTQLDQLAKEKELEVVWKAFELRPEEDELADPPEEMIAQAQKRMENMSKKYGVKLVWNRKSKHSRHALEGSKFAEEQGLGDEYHNAVFAAQFQQEKDIDDIEVLTDIAKQVGLDPVRFHEALTTRKYEEAVLEECDEGYDLMLESIPCYFVDDRRFYSYDALERYLNGKDNKQLNIL